MIFKEAAFRLVRLVWVVYFVVASKIAAPFMQKKQNVILGPATMLHRGVHDSLVQNPPRGFIYQKRNGYHLFHLPRGTELVAPLSPYRYQDVGEFVDFGQGPEIVHGQLLPVLNRCAWFVDIMDNFENTVFTGRYMQWNPAGRTLFWKKWPRRVIHQIGIRVHSMIQAFAHPSCQALFFPSRVAIKRAASLLSRLDDSVGIGVSLRDNFLAKCKVRYPVQKPFPREMIARKWYGRPVPQVLFCGIPFQVKNGMMALNIFLRLARAFKKSRFVYVGLIPKGILSEHRKIFANIDYFPPIPRAKMLELFRRSHILFHPSRSETFGMVYAEAAAAGMAIVTAKGGGNMDHIGEILDSRGAFLLDRDTIPKEREEGVFEEYLKSLLENVERARSMGYWNYGLTIRGKLSLKTRDEQLKELYRRALERPARTFFSLDQLNHRKKVITFCFESEQLQKDFERFFSETYA